ncbi:unnamed protein product, partial [Polarella glacialis]
GKLKGQLTGGTPPGPSQRLVSIRNYSFFLFSQAATSPETEVADDAEARRSAERQRERERKKTVCYLTAQWYGNAIKETEIECLALFAMRQATTQTHTHTHENNNHSTRQQQKQTNTQQQITQAATVIQGWQYCLTRDFQVAFATEKISNQNAILNPTFFKIWKGCSGLCSAPYVGQGPGSFAAGAALFEAHEPSEQIITLSMSTTCHHSLCLLHLPMPRCTAAWCSRARRGVPTSQLPPSFPLSVCVCV